MQLENEREEHTVPTQQHRRRSYTPLLRNLHHGLGREQRTTGRSQWTIRLDQNTFGLAEIDNFLLRQVRMVLNLVCGGHNGCFGQQLLEIGHTEVGDANGLDFACGRQFLHVFPSVDVVVAEDHVARDAVGEFGEEGMVSLMGQSFTS